MVAGLRTGVKESPYDPLVRAGVEVLIRSTHEPGRPRDGYAGRGSTWRFVMRDPQQAAHLPGRLLKSFGKGHVLWAVRCLGCCAAQGSHKP